MSKTPIMVTNFDKQCPHAGMANKVCIYVMNRCSLRTYNSDCQQAHT